MCHGDREERESMKDAKSENQRVLTAFLVSLTQFPISAALEGIDLIICRQLLQELILVLLVQYRHQRTINKGRKIGTWSVLSSGSPAGFSGLGRDPELKTAAPMRKTSVTALR